MASADQQRRAQQRCIVLGETASNEISRQASLNLAESYELLLMIDRKLDRGALTGSKP